MALRISAGTTTWPLGEVRTSDIWAAAQLPSHHTDPFDRMLIAQVQAEGLVCVTLDRIFDAYGVATLW